MLSLKVNFAHGTECQTYKFSWIFSYCITIIICSCNVFMNFFLGKLCWLPFFTIWYFIDNTMCSRMPLKRLNKTRLRNRISVLIIIPRQVSSFELCLIGYVHLPFSLSDIEPKEVILDFFLKILNRTCIAWKVKSCSRPIPHSNIMKISMNQFQVYLKSTHS